MRIRLVETKVNITRDLYVRNTVGGTKLWVNFAVLIGGK